MANIATIKNNTKKHKNIINRNKNANYEWKNCNCRSYTLCQLKIKYLAKSISVKATIFAKKQQKTE